MNKLIILTIIITLTLSAQYDPETSRMLQSYSIVNHCSYRQIVDWSCQICKKLDQLETFIYVHNDQTSVAVFGGFHKKLNKIVLFFRGTIDVKNWIQDFSYELIPYKFCSKCKVHAGFFLAFQSIQINFSFATTRLVNAYPDTQILVVGSSLGAALATIAAIDLKLRFKSKVIQLHTFGSPRVGNVDLAMFIQMRVPNYRVVHFHDIIPHLPLQSQQFHHLPREVLFDQEMKTYKICNEEGQDSSCSNSFSPNFSVNDHISYWQKLDVHEICG